MPFHVGITQCVSCITEPRYPFCSRVLFLLYSPHEIPCAAEVMARIGLGVKHALTTTERSRSDSGPAMSVLSINKSGNDMKGGGHTLNNVVCMLNRKSVMVSIVLSLQSSYGAP